ncbi:MAG: restriction endonuclease subunit S [Clostridia bacterium]|nr:restriction endonuclease subunit S [Clostridia bacterium]
MEYKKISELTTVVTGGTPSTSVAEYWDNGTIPWLQSGCCQNSDVNSTEKFITQAGYDNSSTRIMPKDTVMIALTGATAGKIGYLAFEACGNQSITGILPCESLNQRFLFYYLISQRPQILADCVGGAQAHISQGYVKNIEIPLYTLEEQKQIVEVLDKVTSVLTAREGELQKLDELVKARFVEMFGDPVLNEKGWPTKPLLEMGSCKNGMNFHYDDKGVEINCLGVGDFKDYSVITDTSALPTVSLNEMPSEEYLLKDDDIVFVRSNGNKALVGRSVAVYPSEIPTTFSGFCIRYRKTDDAVLIPYLLRVLKTDSIRIKMAGRGANIQNLNQQILGTLIIPIPPVELQNQFAEFCKQLDKSKVVVQKALDEAQLLFDCLMQLYFAK